MAVETRAAGIDSICKQKMITVYLLVLLAKSYILKRDKNRQNGSYLLEKRYGQSGGFFIYLII